MEVFGKRTVIQYSRSCIIINKNDFPVTLYFALKLPFYHSY
jgi:hypothetical protein